MSGSKGSTSRVSIPKNVERIIEEIKQIADKHSDEDIYAMLKECNMDPNETAQKLLYLDTFHEVKRKRDRRKVKESSKDFEEYRRRPSMRRRESKGARENFSSHDVSDATRDGRNVNGRTQNGVINHSNKQSTSASSSTGSASGSTSVSNGSGTHGPVWQLHSSTGVSGINSSASDPGLVPPVNSWNPGAVGTIKRDIGSQCIVAECIATTLVTGSKSSSQDVANSSQASFKILKPFNKTKSDKSQGVEKVVVPVAIENSESLSTNGPVLGATTMKLDMQLEKLNISPPQPVIFPDHLLVPEAFKSQLTFGSLDNVFGGEGSTPVADTGREIGEEAGEPIVSNQSVSSTAQVGDHPVHPEAPHMPENLSLLEDNVASGSVLSYDLSNKKIMSSLGVPQFPLLQPAQDYSFGLVPPLLGPHPVQLEGHELQGENTVFPPPSGSTPPATQPMGGRQSSVPVPPHIFPLFRQSYPPNYISYNPYLPHIYLPQNAHQFIGQNGFPQPPSTGNLYIPPAAAASGPKFPVASPYQPGNAGLTPLGTPSGYASYGFSAGGFSPSAAMNPGSSAGTEELSASEIKGENLSSGVQQGGDSHAWTPAAGRDISSLQANYFYNLPQGQHIGFSPAQASHGAFAGIYHPSQTMALPTVQPRLNKSQAMAASVESVIPPVAYQQPQNAHMNWTAPLLSKENI